MSRAMDGRHAVPLGSVSPLGLLRQTGSDSVRRIWLPAVLVVACLIAGTALRLNAYARDASLWGDEAMLALNVVHRTPAELLLPLDLNQGAPVGYLLLVKAVVKCLGPSELALRAVSLSAGLVGLALFIRLAFAVLSRSAAQIAVGLFALSPFLVGYSAEFKQFELDAAIAVGLMLIGLPVWRGEADHWRLVGFAIAGSTAVWCSHPAVFVLGGVGLAFLVDALARRNWSDLASRFAVVAAWLLSFGACYWLILRHLGMNAYLLDFWAGAFLPLPPTRMGDLSWVVHHGLAFFEAPAGFATIEFGAGGLAAACFGVGCLALVHTDRRLLLALLLPLVLAMLTSGLRKYPFAGRLLLFAVPAALLVIGHGASLIRERIGRSGGIVLLGMLFLAPVAECYSQLSKPMHDEESREVIEQVYERWQTGDRVYVAHGAAPAFGFYQQRFPFPPEAVTIGADHRADWRRLRAELDLFRGVRRLWVIVAHRTEAEEAVLMAYLDMLGRREDELHRADATLLRYDLRGE